MHDIRVVELPHDAGLTQKVPSLLLCVAHFQRLDGHRHVPLSGKFEPAAADLPELSLGGLKRLTSEKWVWKKIKINTNEALYTVADSFGGIQIASLHVILREV